MRMTVLASGSKGNSTVIASANTRLLVDAGLSCRELLKRMKLADEDPAALDAILITHEHQDHVAGLATLARRLRIPVYLTEPTHRAWVRMVTPRTTMTYAQWLDHIQAERLGPHRSRHRTGSSTTPVRWRSIILSHGTRSAGPDGVLWLPVRRRIRRGLVFRPGRGRAIGHRWVRCAG